MRTLLYRRDFFPDRRSAFADIRAWKNYQGEFLASLCRRRVRNAWRCERWRASPFLSADAGKHYGSQTIFSPACRKSVPCFCHGKRRNCREAASFCRPRKGGRTPALRWPCDRPCTVMRPRKRGRQMQGILRRAKGVAQRREAIEWQQCRCSFRSGG